MTLTYDDYGRDPGPQSAMDVAEHIAPADRQPSRWGAVDVDQEAGKWPGPPRSSARPMDGVYTFADGSQLTLAEMIDRNWPGSPTARG
jgi:hypothetical protein